MPNPVVAGPEGTSRRPFPFPLKGRRPGPAYTRDVSRARAFFIRTLRTVRLLIQDRGIPRPLRWGGAAGLLPIPGPLDELVLLVVAALLWLFYRDRFSEAWQRAEATS